MGGKVWVESELGKGSTFHFTAQFGRVAPRAGGSWTTTSEWIGRRALIVDDNAAALDVLGRMLETLGVRVDGAQSGDRAQSGDEALGVLARDAVPYHWLMIDWKMPGVDGIECARRVLRGPAPPTVVLVTGFSRDEALRASDGVGLAGVLNKPITPSSLHDCLVQTAPLQAGGARVGKRRAAADGTVVAADRSVDEAARGRLSGARILLVEDHPLNQELAGEMLRRAGLSVSLAADGRDALEQLATGGPFDGVLMDCQMPVLDGYDATRALRADPRFASLTVIAMTASALAEDRQRALASGMNAHITKPIQVDSMLRTMAQWIAGPDARDAPVPPPLERSDGSDRTEPEPIDEAAGLAYCMNNSQLYGRLLQGFEDAEAGFVESVRHALGARDCEAARRRSHDTRGLAGTLGAAEVDRRMQALHQALAVGDAAAGNARLDAVDVEMRRVLRRIDGLRKRHPATPRGSGTSTAPSAG